jgi:hypothetical protein
MTYTDWLAWAKLVSDVEGLVKRYKVDHSLVFHGTTSHVVDDIVHKGLRPTIVSHARFTDDAMIGDHDTLRHYGSFWGNVTTAAWYAHTGVTDRHGYGKPVLIAALTSEFGNEIPLMPDRSSAISPVDPNAPIHDHKILDRWLVEGHQRDWRDALDDIGAVYAVHNERLPTHKFRVISSIDELASMLEMRLDLDEVLQPR